MTQFNRMRIFFRSCLLFFSRHAEAKIENSLHIKDGFSVIDNVLYYISGKTKIKIKEHFAETKVTALDLVESAIRYEKRTQTAG
ncbi:MAG: hypothetical protein K2O14_03155 [Oscillospiraceae bacterium]|nr:hypothetical protein [Oscillospiraceae bacterium]